MAGARGHHRRLQNALAVTYLRRDRLPARAHRRRKHEAYATPPSAHAGHARARAGRADPRTGEQYGLDLERALPRADHGLDRAAASRPSSSARSARIPCITTNWPSCAAEARVRDRPVGRIIKAQFGGSPRSTCPTRSAAPASAGPREFDARHATSACVRPSRPAGGPLPPPPQLPARAAARVAERPVPGAAMSMCSRPARCSRCCPLSPSPGRRGADRHLAEPGCRSLSLRRPAVPSSG